MSTFNLLETVGRTKIGSKIRVKEGMNKKCFDSSFTLYPGCEVLVTNSFGKDGVYGIADLGNRLQKVSFDVEEYHLLEVVDETEEGRG